MMQTTVFLTLNRRGVVKATKGKPALRRDEIGISIKLAVPDSAFLAPVVEATLTVPDHAVIVPELTVEIADQGEPA